MLCAKTMFVRRMVVIALLLGSATRLAAAAPAPAAEYYTESPLFNSRPDPHAERHFGNVGVTGLKVRIYPDVTVQVEETMPGTPAAGKFDKGDVISGVNGVTLKGRNPYVVIGSALTEAEATRGQLVFDVCAAADKATKQVTVSIPVLGAYSATWPLACKKSQTIVQQAAAYYAQTLMHFEMPAKGNDEATEDRGVPGALACLFLLSTGDEQYVPLVKAYFDRMSKNIKGLGENTWNNGYNGIACAEYYLRTGDKTVLPVLQYYCDDARDRQFYGIGWGHWGREISPGYVAGGLMNPAGAQEVTTLLLGQACGVQVDDKTLQGALQYFFRFAGHGNVAYGDHRGEGGFGSNGKDGMVAAMMEVAAGAKGDVTIYRQARDCLGLSMLDSYPTLATGHADEGRGDAIWRGLASAFVLDFNPAVYHETMQRLQWWFDLSRRPSGALGIATLHCFDDEGSGAALALAYTAPRKTLQITGAPRSPYAKDFSLPAQLWGRPADRAFLSNENGTPYGQYGTNEPVHLPYFQFGNAYATPAITNLMCVPRPEMVKNVYHHNYLIRAQAAKALLHTGAFGELEKLLQDQDPRIRRAALDGITDYRYWFVKGKDSINPQDFSPAMLTSIRKMLADPEEAWYVIDGALLAISCAPAKEIAGSLPLILPWTTCDEWWLRESAFLALSAATREKALEPKVLPVLVNTMLGEQRPQSREVMQGEMARLLKSCPPDSQAAKQIMGAFLCAAGEGPILTGPRGGEGGYYVTEAALACLKAEVGSAVDVARTVTTRFPVLETRFVVKVIDALLPLREKLPEPKRTELTGLLCGAYRQELLRRMKTGESPLNTILSLTQLKHPALGWYDLGIPAATNRVWQFKSFEPQAGDFLHPREGKRFRDVTLPDGLAQWYLPEFDASRWTTGQAPIGKGVFKAKRGTQPVVENHSTWGDGEMLLMRTTFNLAAVDYDFVRVSVLAKQGYHIYLNGHLINTYIWWCDTPEYRSIGLGADAVQHLKKGTNVLAVYANAAYVDGMPVGQIDVRVEGLKQADLLKE